MASKIERERERKGEKEKRRPVVLCAARGVRDSTQTMFSPAVQNGVASSHSQRDCAIRSGMPVLSSSLNMVCTASGHGLQKDTEREGEKERERERKSLLLCLCVHQGAHIPCFLPRYRMLRPVAMAYATVRSDQLCLFVLSVFEHGVYSERAGMVLWNVVCFFLGGREEREKETETEVRESLLLYVLRASGSTYHVFPRCTECCGQQRSVRDDCVISYV
jgi:hypothetical protein